MDGLRTHMLGAGNSLFGLALGYLVLAVTCAALTVIAPRLYPRLTQ